MLARSPRLPRSGGQPPVAPLRRSAAASQPGRGPVALRSMAYFAAPAGSAPVALDMGSMGKGQIWVNGNNAGRYWSYRASGSCGACSYAGTFSEAKCQTNCGDISQRWYHVPRAWLKPSGNLLVVLEEFGGDLSGQGASRPSPRSAGAPPHPSPVAAPPPSAAGLPVEKWKGFVYSRIRKN